MTNSTDETTAERVDGESADGTAGDELPDVACTLTPEQEAERGEWVEANVLPHLEGVEEHERGFSLVVDRNASAYAAVTELAWRESNCCAWATFEVELPSNGGVVKWNARSDREAGAEFLGDGLRAYLRGVEGVSTPG